MKMYSSVRGPHLPPDQSPGPRQHLCTCIRWDNSHAESYTCAEVLCRIRTWDTWSQTQRQAYGVLRSKSFPKSTQDFIIDTDFMWKALWYCSDKWQYKAPRQTESELSPKEAALDLEYSLPAGKPMEKSLSCSKGSQPPFGGQFIPGKLSEYLEAAQSVSHLPPQGRAGKISCDYGDQSPTTSS